MPYVEIFESLLKNTNCINLYGTIYEIFEGNLNIHWVFEDVMGFLAVITGAKNDIVFMLKKTHIFL